MPGRQHTKAGNAPGKRSKARGNLEKRSLNALAIASKQAPDRPKKLGHRLGETAGEPARTKHRKHEDEDGQSSGDDGARSKRRRLRAADNGSDVEEGSDSDGNQWRLGEVDSDDDSELDSDDAMGESDEERFESFAFRGSSSSKHKGPGSTRGNRDISSKRGRVPPTLEQGRDKLLEVESDPDGDDLGDDAIDLAAMLDATEEEEEGERPKPSRPKNRADVEGPSRFESEDQFDSGESEEDEDSNSLFSDTGDGEVDEARLTALHELVAALEPATPATALKRKRLQSDNLESRAPSDFGLTSSQKLTVADLMPSVTDAALQTSLRLLSTDNDRRTSKRSEGIPKKLEAPLTKRQQDRLDRSAAYVKSKETLDRWIDTVKHNRRAEHLSFPLIDPNAVVAKAGKRMAPTSSHTPQNELEGTIQSILEQSGLVTAVGTMDEGQVQAFEELQTNKLPLEEVETRRAQLRMARELLFREEVRAKRIKKIKSKSYRRVHRKQRERNERETKASLLAAGVDLSEDELEAADRRRAEERMGARHRESKWAKSVKATGRGAWDDDARSGVTEMAKRGEELRKRIEGKTARKEDDGDSESSSESSDDPYYSDADGKASERQNANLLKDLDRANTGPTVEQGPGFQLSSMKFMQKADAARRAENDQATKGLRLDLAGESASSSEEDSVVVGRRKYGLQTSTGADWKDSGRTKGSEFEERMESDESDSEHPRIIVDESAGETIPASRTARHETSAAKLFPSSFGAKSRAKSSNPFSTDASLSMQAKAPQRQPLFPEQIENEQAVSVHGRPESGRKVPNGNSDPRKSHVQARESQVSANTEQWKEVEVRHDHGDSEEESEVSSAGEVELAPVSRSQHDLKIRAFAGDEVVEHFENEKKQTIADEDEKVVDNTLPGWGNWVGTGLSKKERKRNQGRDLTKVDGIAEKNRKDAKLDRVIINEKRIKKNTKYLASNLPHPFETRQQYERSLRLPIGPEWTTKETFQDATKPRILIKQGIIAPMKKPLL